MVSIDRFGSRLIMSRGLSHAGSCMCLKIGRLDNETSLKIDLEIRNSYIGIFDCEMYRLTRCFVVNFGIVENC